ncbi:1-acyl-sn-glycerol-3-phosphate acyltransferase [Weeksellaceae bacterium KMM 9713]|uniref:1-acyl-sn-glycerol-3-phosphate acyltransferase n=1 Tax=Profundicola chukchiensis TaxID=2961959 RepID=A0A9X4MYT7_9FLAO|nr:1-acyl-sn-glycerol-3-phosphate acyltransferase [Profundicola chukchiensis]MDG4946090.1 1-acyl-sn-glycerol-3-phosphate acyltransferase [Profundicola chukchiensis]MDG4951071.1 1-acyl-sn-glycerol-3-phosphate acyltransferase [Profundicola chukchiensis]
MKKIIGSLVLKLMGWKLIVEEDLSQIRSCVMVCGPHTSNWDFVIAVGAFWKLGIPMKLFIKDDWTKPWYGFIIKWLGGIGVNRAQGQNLVKHAGNMLRDENQRLYLLNTPEGTRGWVEKWKKGFYYIAKQGEVPLLFATSDYKKKEAIIKGYIDPQKHSLEEVLEFAKVVYKDIHPKYPENFNRDIK